MILVALSLSCVGRVPSTQAGVDVLVIAPHPDDEVLMAGGVMRHAVARGQRVAVVVMTNGDLTCERDGAVRQAETVAALQAIGLPEDAVRFFGYPDGHLDQLGATPLPPVARLGVDGRCGLAAETWANRGMGRVDEHTRRTGRPAGFTATALIDDLAAVLGELRPRDVYLPHGVDAHPDHAMTYAFFRRALDRLDRAPRRVHRSVVHARGDRCWPSSCAEPLSLDTPLPPLPAALASVVADERVAVDARAKLSWIARYASQLEGPVERDWLAGFARTDEAFFTESYRRDGAGWRRAEGAPGDDEEGAAVRPVDAK
ncbi:MAG: PIG-L family deacetylase [Myxococcus sp.]|nr:PIG-L family deacetylase [Myxococcus sp.]